MKDSLWPQAQGPDMNTFLPDLQGQGAGDIYSLINVLGPELILVGGWENVVGKLRQK